MAFAGNGKLLATTCRDGQVHLWDFATGKEVRRFGTGHVVGYVFHDDDLRMAVSANGDRLAFLDQRNQVSVCHLPRGSITAIALNELPLALDLSPDGKVMALVKRDGIEFWDTVSAKRIHRLNAKYEAVIPPSNAIAFCPDGKRVAAAGTDKIIRLVEVATGQEVAQLSGHTDSVSCLAFAPDGKTLASGSWDNTIRLWDLRTKKETNLLEGRAGRVRSVVFAPDGRTLASGAEDFDVRLWEVATGQIRTKLRHVVYAAVPVAFSPDGKVLAAGGSNRICFWEMPTGKELPHFGADLESVGQLAFTPDGTTLLSLGWDIGVQFWDPSSGIERHPFGGPDERPGCSALAPDGSAFVGRRPRSENGWDNRFALWTIGRGGLPGGMRDCPVRGESMALSAGGRLLAVANKDGSATLWDTSLGREIGQVGKKLADPEAWLSDGLVISSDARLLAILRCRSFFAGFGSSYRHTSSLSFWDTSTGRPWRQMLGYHDESAWCVCSADGRKLALSTPDSYSSVQVWDTALGAMSGTFKVPHEEIRTVAFSPDGKVLAASCNDGTIFLWDLATGEVRHRFEGHRGSVHALGFSPSGHRLASTSGDGTGLIWQVPSPISK
jgi:WD40 repeat protein